MFVMLTLLFQHKRGPFFSLVCVSGDLAVVFSPFFCSQVLHDAFFKHQTKPPLTQAGDLYYEGKEFEAKNQEHKPGHISAELREVR